MWLPVTLRADRLRHTAAIAGRGVDVCYARRRHAHVIEQGGKVMCECEDTTIDYPDCEKHVHCDSRCMALREPFSRDDLEAAYEHWRYHGYLSGCSHGA